MKLKCFLAVCLLLNAASHSSATSRDSSSDITISVCRIQYTPLGKAANWHFDYIYIVETNDEGAIENVAKLKNEKRPALVLEDKIVECIKTWKLYPSSKHTVLFSIGTSGDMNYISIIAPNRNRIKLVLQ